MLSEGTYIGDLVSSAAGTSGTGTPYVCLDFNVTHQWDGQEWQAPLINETRSVYLYLSDAAWDYTHTKLDALGFNGRFDSEISFDSERAKNVELVCKHEFYNDKNREKWDLGGYGSVEHKPIADDKIRQLNARWKNEAGPSQPKSRPVGSPKRPSTVTDHVENDMVPF